jgi:hypothetical protein
MQEFSGGEVPCSVLRWKSKVDLSSKGLKSFICREGKGKATWGHAAGPETGGPLGQVGNQVL